ncbi:hypothetical protein PPACK8108_LOCUS16582 [Phakopsora pachyrhizi]|uniref:Uncharacterized protein n=1 Tax=Phakopsora pachyrhizi TaxID=170000 RepID=A0AAV0BB91_PHAPC|nr:hypothetical protein PPACK8108_LOCUS16582 [Phakopsora pachyrhizi]
MRKCSKKNAFYLGSVSDDHHKEEEEEDKEDEEEYNDDLHDILRGGRGDIRLVNLLPPPGPISMGESWLSA